MQCEVFSASNGFSEEALRFLADREAENTVMIGVALACRREPPQDAIIAAVAEGAVVRLAAIMTPPYALVLSAGDPEAIPHLASALRRVGVSPTGVTGPEPLADRFYRTWCGENVAAERPVRMVLYRASRIAAPRDVEGELRAAEPADLDLLAAWQRRFAEQVGLSAAEQAVDMRAIMAGRLERGEIYLWAVDGRPVASVSFVPTTPGADAGRINAVFTLEHARGKGYASACVAAVSRRLLDRGWRFCLIFADRDSPITTRIYPRLGYQEVGPYAMIPFDQRG